MENEKTTKKNLIYFPLGTVGRDAVYCLVNSYLLTFMMFTHSLNGAQLAAITGIMIAARVFDALNDPVMGNIIERTRSRFGKFKPWLVAGGLSTSAVIYLMFNISLQGWGFVCFFGFMYFAFSITYTMSDISYWGMIPALGSNADVRNQFTSRTTLFAGIGATLASILIPMFTTGSGAIGNWGCLGYLTERKTALCTNADWTSKFFWWIATWGPNPARHFRLREMGGLFTIRHGELRAVA